MDYQEQADEVASLLETRLGVRGRGLEVKLRKAGRLLPADVRRSGAVLVKARQFQSSPKLARMVNAEVTLTAYENCKKFLSNIDAWDRRKGRIISVLSTNAFNLLVITGLVIAVMSWRNLI